MNNLSLELAAQSALVHNHLVSWLTNDVDPNEVIVWFTTAKDAAAIMRDRYPNITELPLSDVDFLIDFIVIHWAEIHSNELP